MADVDPGMVKNLMARRAGGGPGMPPGGGGPGMAPRPPMGGGAPGGGPAEIKSALTAVVQALTKIIGMIPGGAPGAGGPPPGGMPPGGAPPMPPKPPITGAPL